MRLVNYHETCLTRRILGNTESIKNIHETQTFKKTWIKLESITLSNINNLNISQKMYIWEVTRGKRKRTGTKRVDKKKQKHNNKATLNKQIRRKDWLKIKTMLYCFCSSGRIQTGSLSTTSWLNNWIFACFFIMILLILTFS